jgi:hypothetical protein
MIGYDATFTATSAIRLAYRPKLTPAEVLQELNLLQGAQAVSGASGSIHFSGDYSHGQGSNPVDKPVPILQLHSDGTISLAPVR